VYFKRSQAICRGFPLNKNALKVALLKVEGPDIYIPTVTGKSEQLQFTMLAVGGAVQLVATNFPNEGTLDPQ